MVAPNFAIHGYPSASTALSQVLSSPLLALEHPALVAIIFSSTVFSAAASSPLSDPSRPGSVNGRDFSHPGEGRCLQPGSRGCLPRGAWTPGWQDLQPCPALVAWLGRGRGDLWLWVLKPQLPLLLQLGGLYQRAQLGVLRDVGLTHVVSSLCLPLVDLVCWEPTYRLPLLVCWVYTSAPNNKIFLAGDN